MTPDFSRYERIVATRNDRILTLTLTAPNPVNAVDGEMHHELSRIFLDAQDDPASDLIVLTGANHVQPAQDGEATQKEGASALSSISI